MSSVSVPYVTAKLVPAASVVSLSLPRALIVGTLPIAMNAAFGAATSKLMTISPKSSYEAVGDKELAGVFGTGSLYHMIRYAQKGVARNYPIDVLLIKNSQVGGAKTTITLAAAAAAKGTITVDVFNGYEFSAAVNFEAGATVASIAAAITAQLNTGVNKPFSVASSAGVITITWVDGFVSPATPIHVITNDSGLTPVVAHVGNTTPMQPAADVFDILGDVRYTSIVLQDSYFQSIAFANNYLLDRFNAFNTIADGVVYCALTDSFTNLLVNTQTLQGQPISLWVDRKIDGLFGASIGSNAKISPDLKMAFVATAIDRYRVEGADLTDIVSSAVGLLDYRGDIALASLPYHNIAIPATKPSDARWYFDHKDQKTLNANGLSTWGVNRAGVTEITGDARTMWKVDAAGNTNKTWSPLEHLWTASVIREYLFQKLKIYFGKMRLTDGELIAGRSMTNEASIKEELIAWYVELGDNALVVKSDDYIKRFADNCTVSVEAENQLVIITGVYPILTHAGEIDYTIQTVTNYGQAAV